MRVDAHRYPPSPCACLVYLNGVEISDTCFAADDEEGWADCYKRNEDGHIFMVDGRIQTERCFGQIRIVPLRNNKFPVRPLPPGEASWGKWNTDVADNLERLKEPLR